MDAEKGIWWCGGGLGSELGGYYYLGNTNWLVLVCLLSAAEASGLFCRL